MKYIICLFLTCLILTTSYGQPGKIKAALPNPDSLILTGKYEYDTIKVRVYYDDHDASNGWRAYKDMYIIKKFLQSQVPSGQVPTTWGVSTLFYDKKFSIVKVVLWENPEVKEYNWK